MQSPTTIGSICVIRDEQLLNWSVAVCHGDNYRREILARFSSLSEATDFAKNEQRRRNQSGQPTTYALHVDDCPCQLRLDPSVTP